MIMGQPFFYYIKFGLHLALAGNWNYHVIGYVFVFLLTVCQVFHHDPFVCHHFQPVPMTLADMV